MVIGKMVILSETTYPNWPDGKKITLSAVCDDGIPENKAFSKATPQAELSITTTNPPAVEQLEAQGPKYVVVMSPDEYKAFMAGIGAE